MFRLDKALERRAGCDKITMESRRPPNPTRGWMLRKQEMNMKRQKMTYYEEEIVWAGTT